MSIRKIVDTPAYKGPEQRSGSRKGYFSKVHETALRITNQGEEVDSVKFRDNDSKDFIADVREKVSLLYGSENCMIA